MYFKVSKKAIKLKTSQIRTTSLQGTKVLPPKCPLFGGSTVSYCDIFILFCHCHCCIFCLFIIWVSCELLQSTTNIILNLTSTAMGSIATYQCRDGSSDVYTTQCTSDEVWEPNPYSTVDCRKPSKNECFGSWYHIHNWINTRSWIVL